MKPVSPVVPGLDIEEVIYAKDQPEYLQLPAIVGKDGMVVSRWKLTWFERLVVLFCGSVWVWQLTFNHPLQPQKVTAYPPGITEE